MVRERLKQCQLKLMMWKLVLLTALGASLTCDALFFFTCQNQDDSQEVKYLKSRLCSFLNLFVISEGRNCLTSNWYLFFVIWLKENCTQFAPTKRS